MERWVGKTAVVTGASAGIGAAICVRLASEGMRVLGLARRPELVQKLSKDVSGTGKIVAISCDVGKPEAIKAVFDRIEQEFRGIDLLVNNAALLPQGYITDFYPQPLSDQDVDQIVQVNITGLILCTRRAVASMKARGVDGHIININSVAGHYLPTVPIANVYPMTKHAVTAFTTALNDELAHAQARVKTTSISPGLVDTDMGRGVSKDMKVAPPPMLRAADIAAAVAYAVSTPPDVNILELTISALNEKRY